MSKFDQNTWYDYSVLQEYPERKRNQINNLIYTQLFLDDFNTALSFLPLKELKQYEINCQELYQSFKVSDIAISLCDEIYYTTKIEGANTTRIRTQEIHDGKKLDLNNFSSEKMVENGFKATDYLNSSVLKMSHEKIRKLWEIMTEDVCDNQEIAGELYRNGDVVVGNCQGLSPDQIPIAMDHWIAYYNNPVNNQAPFIKAALLHYGFERIHPFCDGNGRIGRMLMTNFLIDQGLDKTKAVSFSKYIGEHVSEYYQSLNQSTNNYFDCTSFLRFMVKAMDHTLADAYIRFRTAEFYSLTDPAQVSLCLTKADCDQYIAQFQKTLTLEENTKLIQERLVYEPKIIIKEEEIEHMF